MLYTPSLQYPARKPTGAKLALKPFHVWGIRVRLQVAHHTRDLALFDLALDSKLRGCDLIRLRVSDLMSPTGVKRRVVILQQRRGGRSSSRSRNRLVDRLPHGSNASILDLRIGCSPAA
jgi:hypothetical protein